MTAKHCPDTPYYMSTGIQLNGAVNGASDRDTQFNAAPSPHTADAKFRVTTSGIDYTVSSVANPGSATAITIYGTYGGRGNGQISQTNVCYQGSQLWCGGFRTNIVTQPGDSGGPCFDGGNARGLVSVGNSTYTWCANIQAIPDSVTILQGSG